MQKFIIAIVTFGVLTALPITSGRASTAGDMVNKIGSATERAAESVADYIDDSRVTSLVKGHFVGVKGLDALDISVKTVNGVVTLSGAVENEAQITLAEHIAYQVKGVKRVNNLLTVKK